MVAAEWIVVEVVWAPRADDVRLMAMKVPAGTKLAEAVASSGWVEAGSACDAGVFGRRQPPSYRLQPYDRVEIYRPLIVDPKEARRRRAAVRKAAKTN